MGPSLRRDLHHSLRLAARGKRSSKEVSRFLLDPAPHLRALADELQAQRYRPGIGQAFWIRDPKPRCIFALPFRDRVVQHLLIGKTLPDIERRLVPQTYACRSEKGTHRCLRRAVELLRSATVLLRIDIRKFFPSIDHAPALATDRPKPEVASDPIRAAGSNPSPPGAPTPAARRAPILKD